MKAKPKQYIMQHNKLLFESDDTITIPMLWNNITGKNFVGKDIVGSDLEQKYIPYLDMMKMTAGLPAGYVQLYLKPGIMKEEFCIPSSPNLEVVKKEFENQGRPPIFKEAVKFSDIFIEDKDGKHSYGLPGKFNLTEEGLKQVKSWHCVQWGNTYHFDTFMDEDENYAVIYLKADQIIASTILAVIEKSSVPIEKEEEEILPVEEKIEEIETTEKLTTTKVFSMCTIVGKVVKLPNVVLDKKLYDDVKKILDTNGGRWKGGKIQGFQFEFDPHDIIQKLSEGETVNKKKEFQFFETQPDLADTVIQIADIQPNDDVLEPSAGKAALIKALWRVLPNKLVYCCEFMETNREHLKTLGKNIQCVGTDFLATQFKNKFDKIIANPPFTKNQDIDHVKYMYECLKPKGRLVSVMSVSWKIGTQKKQVEFRNWLEEIGAVVTDVEQGAFKKSGTNIATVLVTINKK